MKTLLRLTVAALLLMIASAIGADFVQVFPERTDLSDENPGYLHFKDITVRRASSKKLEVKISLQGEIPRKNPPDVSVHYRVYFDLADYEMENPLLKLEGFKDDLFVGISRLSGATTFAPGTRELLTYRGKAWDSGVGSLRVGKDSLSFDVNSDLFAIPKQNIRMVLTIMTVKDAVSKRSDISKVVELPTRSQEAGSATSGGSSR